MNASPLRRTWLLAVVLPLALVAAACGGPTDGVAGGDDAAGPVDEVEGADGEVDDDATDTDTGDGAADPDTAVVSEQRQVLSSAPGNDCSASGHEVTVAPAEELPEEVAAQRVFLIDAALRCDEQLLQTAMDEAGDFRAALDDMEVDAIGLWWELEEAGEQPFLRLAQVLATSPGRTQVDGGALYVWPRVTTGAPEHTTDEAWAEVHWLGDPAAAKAQGDGYLDWRAGISEDGQWRFFVHGD